MLRVHSMASWVLVLAGLILACQYHIASAVTLPTISSLTARFDAGAGVTISSGTSISQWDDLQTSDNTNHPGIGSNVFQSNTALQPKLVAGQVNGLPVVRFDGDTSAG